MADSDPKDNNKLFQVGDHEYLSTPAMDEKINIVMDPNVEGNIHHVCFRRPLPVKEGTSSEALTMGRISFDVTHNRFYCEYCASHELDFDGLWEVWQPSDIATA